MNTLIATLAILALSASGLTAQKRVLVVDDGPDAAPYTSIQAAIDAAQEGDTILIRPGRYAGFTIQGKSLSLVSERPRGASVAQSSVGGKGCFVRGLAAGQSVTLRGLHIYRYSVPSSAVDSGGLEVDNCKGSVWLEDVEMLATSVGRGLTVRDSASVMLTRCDVTTGMLAIRSKVYVYDSSIMGVDGSDEYPRWGLPSVRARGGEHASELRDSNLFTSGSRFRGGDGGQGILYPSASGGVGATLSGASSVQRLDSDFICGSLTPVCGSTSTPGILARGGTVVVVPGQARSVVSNALIQPGDAIRWIFEGQPGDLVFVMLDFRHHPWLHLGHRGAVASPAPFIVPLGVIQGANPHVERLVLPPIHPSMHGFDLFLQGIFVDQAPATILASASALTAMDIVRPAYGKDCDRDGKEDGWQIRAGEVDDFDRDGIPDSCQSHPRIYVDDDAPGDPGPGDPTVSDPLEDGSVAHPFDAIQEAMLKAQAGTYTIVALERGTYKGIGNRNLVFSSDRIAIQGIHGAAATIIDCESAGLAFSFPAGISASARVDGLLITNGSSSYGGAVDIRNSYPTFSRCVFRSNTSTAKSTSLAGGGAINARDGVPHLMECRFEGNRAEWSGGAIALYERGAYSNGRLPVGPTIERCVFQGNSTTINGGAVFLNSHTITYFSGCEFRGNQASSGGALHNKGACVLENCVLFDNTGRTSGGVLLSYGAIELRGCTLANNHSNSTGAIAFAAGGVVLATNTVFWGNDQPQMRLGKGSRVDHCVVEGGAATILGQGVEYGSHNLVINPLFVSIQAGDLRLQVGSPCIDAGDPATTPFLYERDFARGQRLRANDVDIGAYEK